MAREEGDARVIDLDCLRLTGSEFRRMTVRNLKIPFGGKVKVEPEEGKVRGAWRYPSSYSPAVSIEAEANSNPVERTESASQSRYIQAKAEAGTKAEDTLGGAI